MSVYSIKDLEKISGIKAHTIRIWEKRFSLISPERTQTNIRLYNDDELRKILNISILIRNGFKISRIAILSSQEISDKVMLFSQKKSDVTSTIEHLLIAMFELDEHKFEHILSNQILNRGFEDTFTQILYPFFERLGLLWQTGSVIPAQEHFVTNIVRQKLIVAIDSLHTTETTNKQFLLFLPEGELHELGLLFYDYLLKKWGHKVIYLGQSVPVLNLIEIDRVRTSNYMLTVINTTMNKQLFYELFSKLTLSYQGKILITGLQSTIIKDFLNQKLILFKNPEELKKIIN